jgi:hypothetical protein
MKNRGRRGASARRMIVACVRDDSRRFCAQGGAPKRRKTYDYAPQGRFLISEGHGRPTKNKTKNNRKPTENQATCLQGSLSEKPRNANEKAKKKQQKTNEGTKQNAFRAASLRSNGMPPKKQRKSNRKPTKKPSKMPSGQPL